jgi:hypothetical protein
MSAIKEIFDTIKDLTKDKVARDNIKNELKDEFKLNLKFLKDISVGKDVTGERIAQIIGNLEIIELDAFLKCPFPKTLISKGIVTEKIIENINARKLLSKELEPADFEDVCRRIRRMVRYIKKDFSATKEPKKTLFYIKNYILVALKLLR